jgi:hypothetical protein
MPTNYTFVNSSLTGTSTPVALDDYFIPKAPFTQGGLWAWGKNLYAFGQGGQLGDNTLIDRSSPVQVTNGGTNWKQVSANVYGTAAIKTNGTLWMFGYYIGIAANVKTPVQIGTDNNWKQISFSGYNGITVAGIKTDGTLWTWGNQNSVGQLGDGTIVGKSTPVQIGTNTNWKQVSAGNSVMAAIKTDGTLWTWGHNYYGELGNNTNRETDNVLSVSSPIQIYGGGTNWKQVSTAQGISTSVFAIKTDGTLWSWGDNSNGVLGLNDAIPLSETSRSSPVQIYGGGTNWKQVSSGWMTAAAIKTDGTLWLWGLNAGYYSGLGVPASRSSPVQIVGGGTNWKEVSVSAGGMSAIKTDGTLWTWGSNLYGQLGNNVSDGISSSTPIQIYGGNTNWKQVSHGTTHVAAVRTDYY